MFKRSPQKGGGGGVVRGSPVGGKVATIPEDESFRGLEPEHQESQSLLQHHQSLDLLPVTDSVRMSLEGANAAVASSASSSEAGSGTGGKPASPSSSSVDPSPATSGGSSSVASLPKPSGSPKNNATLKMVRMWDVSMGPFKKTIVGGVLVPNALSPVQFLRWSKRRIALELYGEPSPPATEIVTTAAPGGSGGEEGDKFQFADSDVLYLRIYKQDRAHKRRRRKFRLGGGGGKEAGHSGDDEDDDMSAVDTDDDASLISGILHTESFLTSPFRNDDMGKEWKEHRTYKLEEITVLHAGPSVAAASVVLGGVAGGGSGRLLEVKMGSGVQTVTRDIKFDTADDAAGFERLLGKLREREKARAQRKIAQYKLDRLKADKKKGGGDATAGGGGGLARFEPSIDAGLDDHDATERGEGSARGGDDTINLLVEIVSATDLPVADLASTDPFVVVLMGGREVHKTKVVSKTLDPIWTLRKKSLFLLSMTPEEFFSCSSGMTLCIKDYDAVGSNDVLGQVVVGLDELLASKGERVGYDVVLEKNFRESLKDPKKQTKLYLRIKEASRSDIEFMQEFQCDPNKLGVHSEETFLSIVPPSSKFLKRQAKRDGQTTMYRVKPFPDPSRPDETTWMTKEQLIAESLKPSTHWVEAGSGHVGKLFVEVLGCEGLPNMDLSANPRDSTDAFSCIVFEDAIVNTAVIPDCLSPRWMPWCRRAFAFNITHPSSTLLIGLFDFDPEKSPLQVLSRAGGDLHDPIGRIVIRPANYRQNIVYTTAFPLYYGELPEQRQKVNGRIWIRFRMEWAGIRKGLIAAAMPPTPTTVSVHRRVDFQVAHYTVEGPYDENAFDMGVFARYVEELESYEIILNYLREAGYNVWLWRGHFPVTFRSKKYMLPLHSMVAFLWGMIVTWDFNKFPSFLVFSIGWAFVAINGYLRSSPSPWHLVPPYHYMLGALVLDKVMTASPEMREKTRIEPYQGEEEHKAWLQAWEEKKSRWKRDKELEAEHYQDLLKEFGEEQEDEDIATAKDTGLLSNLTVNPLKPVLYPIQLQLKQAVEYIRIAKSIVLWDETFTAFWITTACFAASAVLFWIPFGFLLRWTMRIVAFCVLGPWMAIVDRWYFMEKSGLTDAEKDAIVRERLRSKVESAVLAAANFQIRKERTKKLKDMTRYLFGKFTLSVPRFCTDNFRDTPLPESYAEPYDPKSSSTVTIAERVYGQRLSGDMIPMREVQAATLAAARRKNRNGGTAKEGGGKHKNPLSKIKLVSHVIGGKHHHHPPGSTSVAKSGGGNGAATLSVAERIPLLGRRGKKPSAYSSVAPASSSPPPGTGTGES